MKKMILIVVFALLAGCGAAPAKYSVSNCWGKDDPLRCRQPVPAGCEELAPNMFWCGKTSLEDFKKREVSSRDEKTSQ